MTTPSMIPVIPGMDIQFMIQHARTESLARDCLVCFLFKGIRVVVDQDSDTAELYARWHRDWKAHLTERTGIEATITIYEEDEN